MFIVKVLLKSKFKNWLFSLFLNYSIKKGTLYNTCNTRLNKLYEIKKIKNID